MANPVGVDPFEAFKQQLTDLKNSQNANEVKRVASDVFYRHRLDEQNNRLIAIEQNRVATVRNCAVAGGKIAFKLGAKEVAFQLGKVFWAASAKKGAAITAAKIIPVVSVVVGFGLAAFRIYKGYTTGNREEYVKAVAEVGSGIFACFPGWGTGVSVGLDVAIAGHDIYRGFNPIIDEQSDIDAIIVKVNAKEACNGLGVWREDRLPTKAEIDKAYRNLSPAVHPDHHPDKQEEYTALQTFVNNCKDTIDETLEAHTNLGVYKEDRIPEKEEVDAAYLNLTQADHPDRDAVKQKEYIERLTHSRDIIYQTWGWINLTI